GPLTSKERSGSGGAEVETYAFSHAPRPSEGSPAGTRVSGTITVGIASGKVEKIVQSTVIESPHPELGDREPVRFTSVIEFSDYGIPVRVERPAG
ncbi:hypothetical protein ACFQ07_18145, partial [Actinomadura adrarensis]